MTTPAETTVSGRAAGLPARAAWTVLALAPGAVLYLLWLQPGRIAHLPLALAVALLVEAVALKLRRRPLAGLADGGALLTGLLFALLLPAGTSKVAVAAGAAIAVGVGRQLFGGTGHSLVHPAMLGLGVLMLMLLPGSTVVPAHFAAWPEVQVGAAWLAGGLVLLLRRLIRWEAPLALLLALAVMALPGWIVTGQPAEVIVLPLFAATTWLLAFFVVADPVSGCTTSRGRFIFGAGVAALAALCWRDGPLAAAFVPAVLLMNLAAPALDRWLAPAAAKASPATTAGAGPGPSA